MTKKDFIALADAIRKHNSFDSGQYSGYPKFEASHLYALAIRDANGNRVGEYEVKA